MKTSRRRFLGSAAAVSASVVTPVTHALPEAQTPAIHWDERPEESKALSEFIAQTRYQDLPDSTRRATGRSLLDGVGVSMAAAALEPACQPFLQQATASGTGGAAVLGTAIRCQPIMAALANGALAHALDYEDAHGPTYTHPNAAAIAAAVSLCGETTVSGERLITALAIGCDVTCRLALAQGNVGEPPTQFYPPAIVGTFGAVATAAHLMALTSAQTLDALSLALCSNSPSAAILYSPYSDIRAIRDGLCAQTAVQAVLLAQRGVRGFDRPLEGRGGFFDMVGARYQPGVLTDQLGRRFAGDDVGYKAWPACRANHIYIQTALQWLQQNPHPPLQQITKIVARVTDSDLIVCEPMAQKRQPRAAIDAKFSLYFVLATALITGRVNLQSFTPDQIERGDVLALAQRVHYQRVDAYGEQPLMDIHWQDGRVTPLQAEPLLGAPENPMSDHQLIDKFVDCGLAAPRGHQRTSLESWAQALLSLETHSSVGDVFYQL